MNNGLYRVDFDTPLGSGNGVAVLDNGKLRGGDSAIYYVGSYASDGNNLSASIHVNRHSNGMPSVLGIDSANLELQGTIEKGSAALIGSTPQAPGIALRVRLTQLMG